MLFFLTVLGSACRSKEPADPDNTPNSSLLSNCDVSLTYDAETTTLWEAANPQEAGQLSTADKALMLPQKTRKAETICLKEDGQYTITTEILTPEEPINYPEGTLGKPREPRYKKVINNNGALTYLNAIGEVIGNDGVLTPAFTEALETVEMFKTLKQQPALSSADFENGLAVLTANGMNATQFPNGILASRTNHPDGSYSVAVIDKNARMQTGQLNFDVNGKLQHLYMMKVSGAAPNVVFERMVRVTFIQAVESGVQLKRTEATEYRSFNLNF
ncbi:MAG: hypothetical protein J0L99_21750 [Chitinophagales bacterium]|nr:hypothetical protein [Chitinophagales bacterium]